MNDIEVSSIDLVEGGNVFKQGHYLTLGYVPRDEKGETVDLSGKTLNVALWGRKGVVFEAAATYSAGVIRFTLDKMVPAGDYAVEFTVTSSTDAKYRKKFPTNQHSGRIAIKQSADDLGVVGIQVYTVAQLKAEQKALLDAAVSGFTVDSETKMARVSGTTTHPTIGARLEADKQETAAQLADKAAKSEVRLNTDTKPINVSEMDTETKSLFTGGAVAVVGEDAVGNENVKPKAITQDKTSFASVVLGTANIFNRDAIVSGYNIDTNSTGLYAKAGWFTSELIAAKPNSVYTSNANDRLSEYDSAGVHIRAIIGKTITTGATTGFIRVSGELTKIDTMMLVEGAATPVTFQAYVEKTKIDSLLLNEVSIKEALFTDNKLKKELKVQETNIPFIYRDSVNLFNKETVVENVRLNTNGTTTARTDYVASDFIDVEPSTQYASPYSTIEIIEYDENGQYIKGSVGNLALTTGPTTKRLRHSVYRPHLETFMFVKGSAVPLTYAPYHVYRFNDRIKVSGEVTEKKKFNGGTWNVLGDSITNRPQYSYWTLLAPKLGLTTVNNFGVSGTTISVRSGRTDSFVERYASMPAGDLITVFGHTNDFGTNVPLGVMSDRVNTTFYGACHELINGLVAKYPVNKIAVFTTIPRYNMQEQNTQGHYVHDYADALMEVCGFYGVTSFDVLRNSQIKAYNETAKAAYIPDGLHPNEAGYDLLAEQMFPLLNGI